MKENQSLKELNTFGINTIARQYSSFTSLDELEEIIASNSVEPLMILGGGSNVLFTKNFDGLVLKNDVKGIDIVKEDDDYAIVRAGAGESWHDLVLFALANNLGGLENLSLIPGNVGASPMQNIGAYGVELKDVFESLEAFEIHDEATVSLNKDDCAFGYRDSVFKGKFKNQFVITRVCLKLNKHHELNTSYGAIEEELNRIRMAPSIHSISQAVINIRSSKLPDPKQVGNAGSFFKNPAIPQSDYVPLRTKYPSVPGYPQADGTVKIAAGWMIEQCGWKGYRKGDIGCHAKQALVLVNYGNGTGTEILDLSNEIVDSVKKKFNIELETEVNII